MANTNSWTPNPKQQKVIDFLKAHAGEKFTLNEIAQGVGEDKLATGTTNVLLTKGLIKCDKNARIITCPCCGHKKPQSLYYVDDQPAE